MKVSSALLDASINDPEKAIALVNQFSHSRLALSAHNQAAGLWTYGCASALMRKTFKSNTHTNVFYTGFKACDSYSNGEKAASVIQAKTSFILGKQDQMTPAKAAQSLMNQMKEPQVFQVDAGHSLMSEAPIEVLKALKQALL
jgi:pimeloyl-ACP methyl ester carboxylesterase